MPSVEITREQLIGCWKINSPSAGYIELHDDGTARKKLTSRSTGGDLDLKITWRHIEPSGLQIATYRHGEDEPLVVNEYCAKYFNGKSLEWWEVRYNDHVTENVTHTQPICWQKSKLPVFIIKLPLQNE